MHTYENEYTFALDIDGTVYVVRPERSRIDTLNGDGSPSRIDTYQRTEFVRAVAAALLAGTLL